MKRLSIFIAAVCMIYSNLQAQEKNFHLHCDASLETVAEDSQYGPASLNIQCAAGEWFDNGFSLAAGLGGFQSLKTHSIGPELFTELRRNLSQGPVTPYVTAHLGWAIQIPRSRTDKNGFFTDSSTGYCHSKDGLQTALKIGLCRNFGEHCFCINIITGYCQYFEGKWGKDSFSGRTDKYGILSYDVTQGNIWTRGNVPFCDRFKFTAGIAIGFDL